MKHLSGGWKWAAAALWAGLILLCVLRADDLSAEGLARLAPENRWLAAAVMLALFALKSVSIVVYSGLLYAASGLLFPLPAAIAVNLAGSLVMATVPYFLGRRAGGAAVEAILDKYPRAAFIRRRRGSSDLLFSYLARMVRLPSDVVSLFMGAAGVGYRGYLAGSLLGLLPGAVIFPIIGTSAQDVRSPEFILSVCAQLAYTALTAGICLLLRRRRAKSD